MGFTTLILQINTNRNIVFNNQNENTFNNISDNNEGKVPQQKDIVTKSTNGKRTRDGLTNDQPATHFNNKEFNLQLMENEFMSETNGSINYNTLQFLIRRINITESIVNATLKLSEHGNELIKS